jgi:uncharacterized protein (TIGR03000 family)
VVHLVLLFSFTLSWETAAPAQATEKKPAVFEVLLPADATLEVDGHPTQSTGERRRFQSPPVETGSTYAYLIKATWRGNTITRTIRLRAERVTTVDLRQELQAMPSPKPSGSFSLLVPPAMMLEAGEAAVLPLRVKRFHFPAAIQSAFERLPQGIRIGGVTLAEDRTDIRAPVSVAADTARGTCEISVIARSGSTTAAAMMKIIVRRPETEPVNKSAVKPVPLPETKPASKPESKAETTPETRPDFRPAGPRLQLVLPCTVGLEPGRTRYVGASAELVDLCGSGGSRADEQCSGASVASGGDLAEAIIRYAVGRGEPVCRAVVDGGGNLSAARTERVLLAG